MNLPKAYETETALELQRFFRSLVASSSELSIVHWGRNFQRQHVFFNEKQIIEPPKLK